MKNSNELPLVQGGDKTVCNAISVLLPLAIGTIVIVVTMVLQ